MNFSFFQSPAKNLKNKTITRLLSPIHEHQHNINDGLEFLDDAIRTKDQPLVYSHKSIAERRLKVVHTRSIFKNY